MTDTSLEMRNAFLETLEKHAAAGNALGTVTKELLRTKQLRERIINNSVSNSLIGGTLNWLKGHQVPGAESTMNLYRGLQSNVLSADTGIGAFLRGKANPDSLRYNMFTNTKGALPLKGSKDTFQSIHRASVAKPLTYVANATVVPMAYVGFESLKDPEPIPVVSM